ncbi:MAG: hypothetical protein AB1896_23010, partial [Thermodesulfobacteriota bacterium]
MAKLTDLDPEARALLEAICKETGVDPARTVGMWAVGAALGLDRARTEDASMNLVAEGLLEIRSLSGGVALTEAGAGLAETLAASGPAAA